MLGLCPSAAGVIRLSLWWHASLQNYGIELPSSQSALQFIRLKRNYGRPIPAGRTDGKNVTAEDDLLLKVQVTFYLLLANDPIYEPNSGQPRAREWWPSTHTHSD